MFRTREAKSDWNGGSWDGGESGLAGRNAGLGGRAGVLSMKSRVESRTD